MIAKNTVVRVQIEDLTEQGEGIGRVDGYTLFVKDAVIGDRVEAKVVKAKKQYGYARLSRVLTPSPDRVSPRCPVAGPCGGCQLQAMNYESQLAFKRRKVENHLRRIGGLTVPVEPVIGMEDPWEYRNKAQVPVGRDREGRIVFGFYAGRSHRIVENPCCLLGPAASGPVLAAVKEYMEQFQVEPYDEESGKGTVRHVLIRQSHSTGQILVCLVIHADRLPAADRLTAKLREIPGMASVSLNINKKRNNVILGDRLVPLFGPAVLVDRIGSLSFEISPLSFFQVNPVQTRTLYETVRAFAGLTGGETVWDLYCGIGTISLFLAGEAGKVCGVESVPAAVENARANAERNGIGNAEFFVGKAEEVLPAFVERGKRETGVSPRADVIVVDPPRKGCGEELLGTMCGMAPERIVYVSCNSATLARDLKILCAEGYEVTAVQPVDMFPQTVSVETVVRLSAGRKAGMGPKGNDEGKGEFV